MAGKPRNKPSIQEQIENAKEGDVIQVDPQTEVVIVSDNAKEADPIKFKSHQPVNSNLNCIIAIQALDRISVIHNHPGSCSKNCPAFIASEALRKIRNEK